MHRNHLQLINASPGVPQLAALQRAAGLPVAAAVEQQAGPAAFGGADSVTVRLEAGSPDPFVWEFPFVTGLVAACGGGASLSDTFCIVSQWHRRSRSMHERHPVEKKLIDVLCSRNLENPGGGGVGARGSRSTFGDVRHLAAVSFHLLRTLEVEDRQPLGASVHLGA